MSNREAIAELAKKPCECVRCGDCGGTGRNSYTSPLDPDYEYEVCDRCSGGIVEVCERCMEMRELEEDEL